MKRPFSKIFGRTVIACAPTIMIFTLILIVMSYKDVCYPHGSQNNDQCVWFIFIIFAVIAASIVICFTMLTVVTFLLQITRLSIFGIIPLFLILQAVAMAMHSRATGIDVGQQQTLIDLSDFFTNILLSVVFFLPALWGVKKYEVEQENAEEGMM